MFYSKKLRKFNELKHCFFSRKGGFSKGLYKSLNCGKGSKDNKKIINKNINYVSKKIGVKSFNLVLMHQTHSNRVLEIKKNYYKRKVLSDAMITKNKGIALGVLTADCVPILLFDKKSKIIGCIHAGWKGALSGIIKNTIKSDYFCKAKTRKTYIAIMRDVPLSSSFSEAKSALTLSTEKPI